MRTYDLDFLNPVSPGAPTTVDTLSAFSKVPQRVTGIQKLAQRYVNVLLTAKGSDPFDPARGTSFWRLANSAAAINPHIMTHYAAIANGDAVDQIQASDELLRASYPDKDEQLASATILGFSYDQLNSKLSVRIKLVSRAGTNYTLQTPIQ